MNIFILIIVAIAGVGLGMYFGRKKSNGGLVEPPEQRKKKAENKRYLGNSDANNMEVHDLQNEKGQCQIDKIRKADHVVTFTPDTLEQAHSEGYDNCAFCIGDSKR